MTGKLGVISRSGKVVDSQSTGTQTLPWTEGEGLGRDVFKHFLFYGWTVGDGREQETTLTIKGSDTRESATGN